MLAGWGRWTERQNEARKTVAQLFRRKRILTAGFDGFRSWCNFSFRGLRPALVAAAVAAAAAASLPRSPGGRGGLDGGAAMTALGLGHGIQGGGQQVGAGPPTCSLPTRTCPLCIATEAHTSRP